jgi:hypothetical protein
LNNNNNKNWKDFFEYVKHCIIVNKMMFFNTRINGMFFFFNTSCLWKCLVFSVVEKLLFEFLAMSLKNNMNARLGSQYCTHLKLMGLNPCILRVSKNWFWSHQPEESRVTWSSLKSELKVRSNLNSTYFVSFMGWNQ